MTIQTPTRSFGALDGTAAAVNTVHVMCICHHINCIRYDIHYLHHSTSLDCIGLHQIRLQNSALHQFRLDCRTVHYVTQFRLDCRTVHFIRLDQIAEQYQIRLDCRTVPQIRLDQIAEQYITLHQIRLDCRTVHLIALKHSTYTYVQLYVYIYKYIS